MIHTIVVGADGSEQSATALAWAGSLAQQTAANLVVVHAFEPLAHLAEMTPPYDFVAAERRVKELLENEWTAGLGVGYESRIVSGAPYECIRDVADEVDADLIVVGARGYGAFRAMALGSTSTKLIHTATRPVVVIPDV